MKIIVFTLLLCLAMVNSLAAAEFQLINYKVEKNDSFSRILRKFMKDDSIINGNSLSVRETIKSNPNLNTKEHWLKPAPGMIINLKIEKEFIDTEKMKKYTASLSTDFRSTEVDSKGWKGSIFYMASIGNYKQTSNRYPDISYQQNSYFSLGAGLSFIPVSTLWSYSTSLYFSTLKATGSNLNDDKVTVPNEIGATLYAERVMPNAQLVAYGGLDYDSFSTFNLAAIANQEKIYLDKNMIYYATLGVSKKIDVFGSSFLTKFSFSKSLMSSYESSIGGEDDKLSGYKAMFYINHNISKKFYVHSLVKYHSMKSSSDLSSLRIGLGIGYILF